MNNLSRFLRAVPPICALFVAGAAVLGSGRPVQAKTLSFGGLTSSHTASPVQSRDAFVRVGVDSSIPTNSPDLTHIGGFSNLLGSTEQSASAWRLTQAGGPIVISFANNNVRVNEGAGSINIVVTRSGDTTVPITVNYTTANGVATEPADYTKTASFITFGRNQTTASINVAIVDDALVESAESFTVALSFPAGSPTSASISNSPCQVVIDDNDASIQLEANATTVNENSGPALVRLIRTGSPANSATVSYTTSDGTATGGGVDYTGSDPGQQLQVTFPAGADFVDIPVPVRNDSLDEIAENFTLTLTGVTSSGVTTLGTNKTATVTIEDDDVTQVGLSLAAYQVNEGVGTFNLNVVRPNSVRNDTSRAIQVDYQTIIGSARSPQDYTSTSGTLTFDPDVTSQVIPIDIIDDTLAEDTEDFQVRLSNPRFVTPPGIAISVAISPQTTATISILDNDAAVNFNATSYSVDEAVGTLPVPVTRRFRTDETATVNYTTSNISAVGGQDYTITSGTLTFAPGETTKSILVPIIDDSSDENAEAFRITLSNPTATSIGPDGVTTITINDNDDIPTLTIADVTQNEGNIGTTTLSFNVSLSAPSGRTVTVRYATSDGSATTADQDYVAATNTLVFAPDSSGLGPQTKTIDVTINGDKKFESDEAFLVTLSNPTSATLLVKKAVGGIKNDDSPPSSTFNFQPVQPSFAENIGNATVTITRTPGEGEDLATPASVTLTTANGTAISGADYTAVSTVLTFKAQETSKTVEIPIFDDSVNEADETFTATLSNPQGYASLGANSTATITILNDDAGPTLSIGPASVKEGDSGTTNLVFTATIDASSEQPLTVQYATADGTATVADNDYVATSGTLTFEPGDRNKTITVLVNGDLKIEDDETLSLLLTNPQNLTLANSSAVGTILKDDTPPTFSNVAFEVTSKTVSESVGNVTLNVRRTTGTDRVATIDYATSNGTATAGVDYTAKSGTLTFEVGQTTATITVPVIDDTLQELGGAETFKVTLSNPGGNSLPPSPTVATVSITDNEGAPTLSVANTNVLEGDSGRSLLVYTVSLFPQSKSTVKVQIATTTGGTATSSGRGQDYRPKTAVLTFAPGQGTQTFAVDVAGDTIVEDNETVNVLLSNAQGAPLASQGKTAVGTILNDDEPGGGGTISFLSPSYTINEDAGNATITLGRTGKVDLINEQSATVRFTTGTGSAAPGQDYKPVNKIVTFPAGETTVSVLVPIVDNNVFENDENVSMSIADPSNNAIMGSITTAKLIITDNDPVSSVPRADGLTPSAPIGSPFTVKATYSIDTVAETTNSKGQNPNDLSPVLIQVGGNANGNGFRALYYPKSNLLTLDPSTGQQARPGSRVLLTNQFGTLDVSKTTVQRSGDSVVVTWTIRLNSSVMLPIYLGATGPTGQSVFIRRGTWRPAATTNSAKGS